MTTVSSMTTEELEAALAKYGVSPKVRWRVTKKLNLKPLGVLRRKPLRWAPETLTKILEALGLVNGQQKADLVGMPELRTERKKARAK